MERSSANGLPEFGRRQLMASAAADERSSLRRTQELDRALFPTSAGPGTSYQGEDTGSAGNSVGALPPIRSQTSREQEAVDSRADVRASASEGPTASARRGANGAPTSKDKARRANGGKANFPARGPGGAFTGNPFEGTVDATLTVRHGMRDWRQLELLPSSGSVRMDIMELEDDLATFLHDSLAISAQCPQLPTNAQLAAAPQPPPPPPAPVPILPWAGAQHMLPPGAAPSATVGTQCSSGGGYGCQTQQLAPQMSTAPPSLPAPPWPSPTDPQGWHTTTSSAFVPPTAGGEADSGGAGKWAHQRAPPPLMVGKQNYPVLTQLSQMLGVEGAGEPPSPHRPATPTIGNDVNLLGFISDRHSARHHAQVASDWLDQAVARAWQQCAPEDAVIAPAATAGGGSGGGRPGSPHQHSQHSSPRFRSPGRKSGPAAFESCAASVWDALAACSSPGGRLEDFALVADPNNRLRAMAEGSRPGRARRVSGSGPRPPVLDASAIVSSPPLRRALANAVEACSTNFLAHVAHGCFEDGAMLARLWNLHTVLLDIGSVQLRQENSVLAETAQALHQRVSRLDPLIEWGQEARESITTLSDQLDAASASLLLASRERDGLLRENDKIIMYYKRELRRFKKEQKKSAWKLAKKLKNTQDQLQLMQRDRAQLVGAVSYSRKEAGKMVSLVEGVHHTFATMAKNLDMVDELMSDMNAIDAGLRNMQGGVNKVNEMAMEAEDQHFVNEEAVTKVAADDDTNDDLLDQVLADGDPDDAPAVGIEVDDEIDQMYPPSNSEEDELTEEESLPNLSPRALLPPAAVKHSPRKKEVPLIDLPVFKAAEDIPEDVDTEEASDGPGEGEGEEDGMRPAAALLAAVIHVGGTPVPTGPSPNPTSPPPDAGPVVPHIPTGNTPTPTGNTPVPSSQGTSPAPASPTPVPGEEGKVAKVKKEKKKKKAKGEKAEKPERAERADAAAAAPAREKSEVVTRSNPVREDSGRKAAPAPRQPGGLRGDSEAATPVSRQSQAPSTASPAPSYIQRSPSPGLLVQRQAPTASEGVQTDPTNESDVAEKAARALEALQEQHNAGVSYALVSLGLDPSVASRGYDPMDGLVEGVKQRMAELQRQLDARTSQQQQAETRLDAVSDRLDARGREVAQVTNELQRAEVRAAANLGRHEALRGKLVALGLDPESPVLPKPVEILVPTAMPVIAVAAAVAHTDKATKDSPRKHGKGKGKADKKEDKAEKAEKAAKVVAADDTEGGSEGDGEGSDDDEEKNKDDARSKVTKLLALPVLASTIRKAVSKLSPKKAAVVVPPPPVVKPPPKPATKAPAKSVTLGGEVPGRSGGGTSGDGTAPARAPKATPLQLKSNGGDSGAEESEPTPTGSMSGIPASVVVGKKGTFGNPAANRGGDEGPKKETTKMPPQMRGVPHETMSDYVASTYKRPEQQTGIQRLQEALSRHPDIKSRTIEWLIKLIDNLYRGKGSNDESRAKIQQEPLPMVDFLFYYLSGTYGTRDLVAQYAACVVTSIETHKRADVRVITFQRFLLQIWDIKTLAVYMDASRKLSEPARLPCCDFPTDYSSRKGEPTLVDVRKCLWIADKVLFRRGQDAALTFATALAMKADPIQDPELVQYFVAPGYYGQDIANMRAYELSRAEFRRIQGPTFLEALCEEYVRCEAVMVEALPSIFKKYDANDDGFIEFENVMTMVREMALEASTDVEFNVMAQIFWAKAVAIDQEHSPLLGSDPTARSPTPDGSTSPRHDSKSDVKHLSYTAFMEACMRHDWVRAWVRLNRTPPPKLRLDNGAEEGNRVLLFILISRHWHLHGHAITSCFEDTGPIEPQLLQQVTLLDREKDGARKALLLCTIIKLLIARKLDHLMQQLSTEQLGTAVETSFEDSLDRITRAVKVLYGGRCVLENDLNDMELWSSSGYTMQQERRKLVMSVFGVYNRMRMHIMLNASTQRLAAQFDIVSWTHRWRGVIQARKRAASVVAVSSVKTGNRIERRIRTTKAAASANHAVGPTSPGVTAPTTSFATYVRQQGPEVRSGSLSGGPSANSVGGDAPSGGPRSAGASPSPVSTTGASPEPPSPAPQARLPRAVRAAAAGDDDVEIHKTSILPRRKSRTGVGPDSPPGGAASLSPVPSEGNVSVPLPPVVAAVPAARLSSTTENAEARLALLNRAGGPGSGAPTLPAAVGGVRQGAQPQPSRLGTNPVAAPGPA